MDSLEIVRAAPSMQIQDLGRFSVSHHGLSQGGAVDLHAHCWANFLLDNPIAAATLEILIGNTELLALRDLQLSLTGAEVSASIDGEMIANWSSFSILQGQSLKISYAASGLRCYLAINGGFDAESILGSVSTVLRNDLGANSLESDILKSNQQAPPEILPQIKRTPPEFIPEYSKKITLRVITNDDSELFRRNFTVSPQSDRTGIRLITDKPLKSGSGIISEPNALGAIQLPADGKPIILLNDRQTQGGYQKLGHVAKIDLSLLAQARPGTVMRFKKTSLADAREAWRIFMEFFS